MDDALRFLKHLVDEPSVMPGEPMSGAELESLASGLGYEISAGDIELASRRLYRQLASGATLVDSGPRSDGAASALEQAQDRHEARMQDASKITNELYQAARRLMKNIKR